MEYWLNAWKCMSMSMNNKLGFGYDYYIGAFNLGYVNEVKDLGVYFDYELDFNVHVTNKINIAYKMLGVIKSNFIHLDSEAFVCLFKSQVRSHLVWSMGPMFGRHGRGKTLKD